MQSTLETTDKHVVRLSVEVPPEEFKKDLDRAYRKVAGQVRIPGFRKGKAPRQIIDTMVGREAVIDEFVKDAIPSYYVRAVREHDLAPITDPEIDLDVEEIQEARPLTFTATVEVRPRLELAPESYRGLKVSAPSAEPTEPEIGAYVDQLRERFAELDVVERPAQEGDYVLADVRARVHEREVPEATQEGALILIGSGEPVPELDRELQGKRKGDILKFNATLPEDGRFAEAGGSEVTFQVLVKEVKAKRLPAADDEFAKTASEFDTLEELRQDLRARVREAKQREVDAVVRDRVLRALVDSVDVDLPDRLVDSETEHRIYHSRERLERAGISLEQALDAEGWDELRFRSDARAHAIRDVKADLVLEAVAKSESLEATEEDFSREIAALAQASGRQPKEVARLLEKSGQVRSMASDIIRSKALDLLVEAAEIESESESGTEPTDAAAITAATEEPPADAPQDQGDHEHE